MTPEETSQQKGVEFYAAGVNAWYNTALEHDKSIFGLSAGGVGLLISLLTTLGVQSKLLLVLYGAAILSFLVTLGTLLVIFRRNRDHIEKVLLLGTVPNDPVLKVLDLIAIVAFWLGALFAATVGITSAIHSYESEQKKMATDKTTQVVIPESLLQKSFNGVGRLDSFNGIGRVSPQGAGSGPAAPTPAPGPTSAPPSATPAAPGPTGPSST